MYNNLDILRVVRGLAVNSSLEFDFNECYDSIKHYLEHHKEYNINTINCSVTIDGRLQVNNTFYAVVDKKKQRELLSRMSIKK